MQLPVIESELYRMRPWHSDDGPSLVKHANNPKIASNLRDGFPYPYSLPNARKWLSEVHLGKLLDEHLFALLKEHWK